MERTTKLEGKVTFYLKKNMGTSTKQENTFIRGQHTQRHTHTSHDEVQRQYNNGLDDMEPLKPIYWILKLQIAS